MDAVTHLAPTVGVVAACDFLGVAPARALSPIERASVLTVLHEERFQDRSPAGQLNIHADRGRVAASKTAAPSASSFSSGTTKSTATPASAC